MQKDKEVVIPIDSAQAATYKTDIEGWVSSSGIFYGKDEASARYAGCTHTNCRAGGCRNFARKPYMYCDSCRERRAEAKYLNRPVVKWDGDTPLYSETLAQYFFNEEALYDYLGTDIDLKLLICEPVYLREVAEWYWEEQLPETADMLSDVASKELLAALDKLNKIISDHKPIAWTPGESRVDIE